MTQTSGNPRTDTARTALAGLVGRKSLEKETIPLWHERKHDVYNLAAKDTPVLEGKGGSGSGNFGHEGLHGVWGGSGEGKKPDLGKAAAGRVQFHKNRLAREIVASAAAVKRIDEKPFRGVTDRMEARKHMKQIRKKTKELGIPEEQVWEVIDAFPVEEQAFLASMAKLEKDNSKAKKVVRNVARHLAKQKITDIGAKYAPSPLLEPAEVDKLSIKETLAYIAAYDDPARAVSFLDALKEADFETATRLRSRAKQNVISNTQRNIRNRDWLESASELQAQLRRAREDPGFRPPTQREVEKMISERQREKSRERLGRHRERRGEPVIRFGGFGGQP